MNIIAYAVRGTLLLLGLALATIGLLTIAHTPPVRAVIAPGEGNAPPAPDDPMFALVMERYTGVHLAPGNRVEVLLNGNETYQRLYHDLRRATQSVTMQMYYAKPGAVADSFRDVLAERARAGVDVRVLLDAFGCAALRRTDFLDALRQAGAHVEWLRPIRWYTLNRATNRSHSRGVVVDGRIGYTGGFGIADYWLGDGISPEAWRESNVRFEGPAVAELQATFAAGWAEATGELLTGSAFMTPTMLEQRGTVRAGLLHTVPGIGSTSAERYLALSVVSARHRLWITNSYFVPDQDFRTMLKHAVARGVDVRVLTAGPLSDVKTTWYAGRAYYEELLRGGVRIYEYQPTMMHAKTLVADGLWVSVGSMNFDNRSLALNNETNLVALDSVLGAQMDTIFLNDLAHATEITLPAFTKRGWWPRLLEWCAEKLWRIL